ncbi:cyclophilin-like fold protein [Sporomusa malonica]|uniref:Cyclophilin-like domain-containing protein n=1 Tax=Sporomusa malonica TaxID=112901 RepID=A0A1W1ZBJ2_9FIRM|nr:cyclophilin-like fold protein [Sporomusa malonica]SMC45571.1 hypothetical protein SAMN04488500_103152 [Sporomusa malonica]
MMKKFLNVFVAVMVGFAISLAGCGPETAKGGENNPGTAQPDSAQGGTASSGQGATADTAKTFQGTKIKLTFDGGEAVAELYDNPTSRDLVAMLPLTLSFKDFNSTEKIAYPPRRLSTENAPFGLVPSEGDLALFAPWGNLVIYYHDFRYSKDLVSLGHFTSGLEQLAKMNRDFTVRIEAVNQ